MPIPTPPDTQPSRFSFSLRHLLLLPNRLCNPPPAVGKVRSCGVTPVFKVRLEDVLDRKHLPPLGLKDFEEWLLYVEHCPENLYFILWLREYTRRHTQWVAECRLQRSIFLRSSGNIRHNEVNPQLAMFHARAKHTFFTPKSQYELNVASDILAPFHAAVRPPHPDPAVFDDVAAEVNEMLKESLERFVFASYTNVGSRRAICGIVVGIFCSLVAALPPLLVTFLHNSPRWLRLTALPGLWLGLTVLISSLNGLCLSVYFFGDVRQLRKFELARPPISDPEVQPANSPELVAPASVPQPPQLSYCRTSSHHIRADHSSIPSHAASGSDEGLPEDFEDDSDDSSNTHSSYTASGPCEIYISPEYYDDDEIEGPALSPMAPVHSSFSLHGKEKNHDDSFMGTATFIHSYSSLYDEDAVMDQEMGPTRRTSLPSPEQCQAMDSFDFDALPVRSISHRSRTALEQRQKQISPVIFSPSAPWPLTRPQPAMLPTTFQQHRLHHIASHNQRVSNFWSSSIEVSPPEARLRWNILAPISILRRIQAKCTMKWRLIIHPPSTPPPSHSAAAAVSAVTPPPAGGEKHCASNTTGATIAVHARKQFKLVRAVPAFTVPLTRVLSPIVRRAQWEIVVRSALLALLVSWVILGTLLALPMRR